MKKFKVIIYQAEYSSAEVEVEAEDEQDAKDKAHEEIYSGFYDWNYGDSETTSMEVEELKPDYIERMKQ